MDRNWLLLIAIVLVVAAVFAGVKWNDHREGKRLEAEIYCTMDPEAGSEYSPEFKNCVEAYLD